MATILTLTESQVYLIQEAMLAKINRLKYDIHCIKDCNQDDTEGGKASIIVLEKAIAECKKILDGLE
jgi:hypothetical protein